MNPDERAVRAVVDALVAQDKHCNDHRAWTEGMVGAMFAALDDAGYMVVPAALRPYTKGRPSMEVQW